MSLPEEPISGSSEHNTYQAGIMRGYSDELADLGFRRLVVEANYTSASQAIDKAIARGEQPGGTRRSRYRLDAYGNIVMRDENIS